MTRYPNVYSRSTLRNGKRIAAAGLWGMALACTLLACAPAAYGGPRAHRKGSQFTGRAIISDLQGNTASDVDHYNVSGTNVSVALSIRKSWPSTHHLCTVYLGSRILAQGWSEIRAVPDPQFQPSTNRAYIKTNGNGDWQGRIVFDSTGRLSTDITDDLKLQLIPIEGDPPTEGDPVQKGIPLYSNPIECFQTYNKSYVLGNGADDSIPFEEVADSHAVSLEDMNHSTYPAQSARYSHEKSQIVDKIPSYTVFCISTHGIRYSSTDSAFFDCTYVEGGEGEAGDVDRHAVRSSMVPAKASNQPFYNFVFANACYSAGEDSLNVGYDMASAFGIVTTSGGKKESRAFLGWQGPGWSPDKDWMKEVINQLTLGKTIYQAYVYADTHFPRWGFARILGDYNTTVHSVYVGPIQ